MNFLKKFLLAIIILFVKNIYAANFTVSSPLNNQMSQYNLAVSSDSLVDNIILMMMILYLLILQIVALYHLLLLNIIIKVN